MLEEDDDFSVDSNILHARREYHSPVQYPVACHLIRADEEEKDKEEHFLTAPLNDDVLCNQISLSEIISISIWALHISSTHLHLCQKW